MRFYLIPSGPVALGPPGAVAPKYVHGVADYTALEFNGQYLVAADVTAGQHTAIAANGDVTAIPQDLNGTIGGALGTVQATLEAILIPSQWVEATHTWRQLLKAVAAVFVIHQCFRGLHRRWFFEVGITLNTQMNELTQAQRNALTAAADSLDLDSSSVTGTTTVRQVFVLLANQMPAILLEGEAL